MAVLIQLARNIYLSTFRLNMCAQLTDLLFIAELVKQIPSLSLINNPYFIFMANLLDIFFLYPWGNGLCRELIASITELIVTVRGDWCLQNYRIEAKT